MYKRYNVYDIDVVTLDNIINREERVLYVFYLCRGTEQQTIITCIIKLTQEEVVILKLNGVTITEVIGSFPSVVIGDPTKKYDIFNPDLYVNEYEKRLILDHPAQFADDICTNN